MDDTATTFKYESGVLHISSPLQMLRIRWGEVPEAQVRQSSGKWHDCTPEIRLLKPMSDSQPEDEKARAFAAFRAGIPAEIVHLVEPYSSHQWNMLCFLQKSKEAMDLAVSNSVLTYALANNDEIRNTSHLLTMSHALRNVRRKQRDICEALGFPGSEACVKLFRRIPRESCSPPMLRMLRMALKRDREILVMLGHLKHIHPSIIHLVSREDVFKLVTPKLLMQISDKGETPETAHVGEMLFNVVYHAAQMRHPPAIPRVSSVRAAQEFHDQMMLEIEAEKQRQELARQQAIRAQREQDLGRRARVAVHKERVVLIFPPPPLPGTEQFVPITTESDLRKEGREQHNCVWSYGHLIKGGQLYVFKVLHPQRATLSIRRGPGGSWYMSELKCACNKAVAGETRVTVIMWLDRHNASL